VAKWLIDVQADVGGVSRIRTHRGLGVELSITDAERSVALARGQWR
jgi:hypothetical protein